MDTLNIIMEGVMYALPAAIVVGAIKVMQDARRNQEVDRLRQELRSEVIRQHMPLRLQAYERAVLYLERISPQNLLLREPGVGLSVREHHRHLIDVIRTEFEHNVAQQVYIDSNSWDALVRAKEDMFSVINISYQELDSEAEGVELSRRVVDKFERGRENSIQIAIKLLKRDIGKLFQI